ncbi:MAG TPA: hypothetical protein VHD55_02785 [Candidatus Paceibacterota bacterium]|nr:hypothetical protein [Candidatus Paceibacterota bacterium]
MNQPERAPHLRGPITPRQMEDPAIALEDLTLALKNGSPESVYKTVTEKAEYGAITPEIRDAVSHLAEEWVIGMFGPSSGATPYDEESIGKILKTVQRLEEIQLLKKGQLAESQEFADAAAARLQEYEANAFLSSLEAFKKFLSAVGLQP